MARTKIVLAVIAVIVIVAIALQNTTGVDASQAWWPACWPRSRSVADGLAQRMK
jgi:hypothetical protein